MFRLRTLQVLMVLVGAALVWGAWPLVTSLMQGAASTVIPGDQMILGIYFPLGVLLLLGVRNPVEHRSLLLFTGWSTVTHMAVMIVQAIQAHSVRDDVPTSALIVAIGVAIILLTPRKAEKAGATSA